MTQACADYGDMKHIIASLTNAEPAPQDDGAELRAVIAKTVRERAEAEADLAKIPAALEAAFFVDDNALVEKLEAKRTAAQRAIAKADAVRPVLERKLFDAEESQRNRLLAKHREALGKAFDSLSKALQVVLDANDAAEQVWNAARSELGQLGELLPHIVYSKINREGLDHWRAFFERELQRSPPIATEPLPGIIVRITVTFAQAGNCTYRCDDIVKLPEIEAMRLIEEDQAELVDPVSLPALTNPRQAAPPKPDEQGRLSVVFVQVYMRQSPAGIYAIGDVALFAEAEAVALVRRGVAEFAGLPE
jgi:hypothetical protein